MIALVGTAIAGDPGMVVLWSTARWPASDSQDLMITTTASDRVRPARSRREERLKSVSGEWTGMATDNAAWQCPDNESRCS